MSGEAGWLVVEADGRLHFVAPLAAGAARAVALLAALVQKTCVCTDRMIERAGQLCPRGGWTMVKVAKPDQDMRFDVPTVGPETIENLKRHGAGMLVIEAHKTVIVDRNDMLTAAHRAGIVIVSRSDNS